MGLADERQLRQLGDGRVRQRQLRRRQILMQVGDRRGARNQKDVGRAMQQPRERDLHRSCAEPCRDSERVTTGEV